MFDFAQGAVKEFRPDRKVWQKSAFTFPRNLRHKNLDPNQRVCAEGNGTVYILNTRDMVLHCLDVASRQWTKTRQVDSSYTAKSPAMAYENGRLYVSGGVSLNTRARQKTMISLAVAGDMGSVVTVQQHPDMLYRRDGHSMAGAGGRVLVCGGMGDTSRLANCEVFELRTGIWSRLFDMPVATSYCCLIPTTTDVFVLGGITLDRRGALSLSDTVSVFNWQRRQWAPLPRLPMPLSNIQAAYANGSLWLLAAVTGWREDENNPAQAFYKRLKCVLQYDLATQSWITHDDTPDLGTDGLRAYTFPL